MKIVIKKYEAIIALAISLLISGFNSFEDTNLSLAKPVVSPTATLSDSIILSSGAILQGVYPGRIVRLCDGETLVGKKMVALTFDDGPHPVYTSRLIETLKRHSVPASFFVVGKQAEKYPELLREITSNGFIVGGHSYSHNNLTLFVPQGADLIKEELEKTRLIIKKHTSVDTYIFRPPGGRYDEQLLRLARENGYRMILWDILPKDHIDNLSSSEISFRVVSAVTASQGGIVLMHSGKSATIESLDKIIPELRSLGYTFVALDSGR